MSPLSASGTRSPTPLEGRSLARNAVLNLLGHIVPMLVAVAAIPPLIRQLGIDRFGVLTLVWVVIGYFSLFDLGLGRAVTHMVAEKLGAGGEADVPRIVWTALTLVLGLGLAGSALLGFLGPWLVGQAATLPESLRAEALGATYLLAASLPAVVSTAALRGVLEAAQRFDRVNLLRVPLAIFTYAGPLLVLPFSRSLISVVAVLLVGRMLGWLAHLVLCFRTLSGLRTPAFDPSIVPGLLHFGGWTTATNVVSPLLVYLDRFLIGALLSVTAVTFYVTPFEVVTKLLVIPAALVGVFFPAFAATFGRDREHTTRLYRTSFSVLAIMMFPPMLVVVALAPEGMTLWLGIDFAGESATVLRLLAVGVFVNALAQAPFSAIQGVGRPDLTGKLHLLELPLYAMVLWWAVSTHGIVGAAAAWTARITADAAILFVLADRQLGARGITLRPAGTILVAGVFLIAVSALPPRGEQRAGLLVLVLAATSLLAWRWLLDGTDRQAIRNLLPRRSPPERPERSSPFSDEDPAGPG